MYLELTKAELFDLLRENKVYKIVRVVDDIEQYYVTISNVEIQFEEHDIEYFHILKSTFIDLLRNFYYKCDKFEIKIIE